MEDWLDPCLDAEEMRAIDRWAIEERGVPSLELMETAGRAVAEAAAEHACSGRAAVVCGKGNNGGDGLVAARLLAEMGFEVDALLLARARRALRRRAGESRPISGGTARRAGGDSGRDREGGRGHRRDLRDRLRGCAAGSRRISHRRDQRGADAGRGDGHRLGGQRVDRRGRGHRGRRRPDRDVPRSEAGPLDRPGEGAHRRASGSADRHPDGGSGQAGQRPDPRAGARELFRIEARGRRSSRRVRCDRRRVARD